MGWSRRCRAALVGSTVSRHRPRIPHLAATGRTGLASKSRLMAMIGAVILDFSVSGLAYPVFLGQAAAHTWHQSSSAHTYRRAESVGIQRRVLGDVASLKPLSIALPYDILLVIIDLQQLSAQVSKLYPLAYPPPQTGTTSSSASWSPAATKAKRRKSALPRAASATHLQQRPPYHGNVLIYADSRSRHQYSVHSIRYRLKKKRRKPFVENSAKRRLLDAVAIWTQSLPLGHPCSTFALEVWANDRRRGGRRVVPLLIDDGLPLPSTALGRTDVSARISGPEWQIR